MIRPHTILPALLLGVICYPLFAQWAPQPFLPPPTLRETPKPGAVKLFALAASQQGCDPEAEVSRNGNLLTVNLTVTEQENQIYNPSNGGTRDKVKLRSYGGCLSGPLIDTTPGSTLRVNVDN